MKNKNQNIRKAVILCAGKGTRMMPYTKSQPKEMLPVQTTPLLQIIVEQVIEAGIKEIFIIISDNKECIVNHFNGMYPDIKISYGKQLNPYSLCLESREKKSDFIVYLIFCHNFQTFPVSKVR